MKPEDKIRTLKEKLSSDLGVPVSSQQLIWWGETLPNETTLEDNCIPTTAASIHLAYGTRDPRLKYALSGSSDGGLRLWSMRDGELVRDFNSGGNNAVLAISVHWESMRAIAGCFSGQVQLWDLNTGELVKAFEGHKEEVQCVEVNWATMRALTGASDSSAKLWDLEKGELIHTLAAGSTVYSLSVDWEKNQACGGLRSGFVRMWDLETGAALKDFTQGAATAKTSNTAVSATSIDCVGGRAVSGLEDGHLVYWFFGKEGTGAASGSDDTPVAKEDATKPKAKVLLAHYCAIRSIAAHWSTDRGSRALCGSDDGSLSLWRLDSQECLARFARHVGYVWTLSADWARGRALSGAFDGCFKLWDLRTGECLRTVQSHVRPVRSIAGGGSN